jgi:DNA-binding MarR family transcriptional regulator
VEPETEKTDPAWVELGHEFVRYHHVIHSLKTQLAEILPAGLDPAAAQLLAWLARLGPTRQSQLAEGTFLDPSTVSRRVSQLVQLGLVERRADPMDGRAVQLVPTELGQTYFTAIRDRRQKIIEHVVGDWSRDEVAALSGLLQKFNDDFETYRTRTNAPSPALTHIAPAPSEENHDHP